MSDDRWYAERYAKTGTWEAPPTSNMSDVPMPQETRRAHRDLDRLLEEFDRRIRKRRRWRIAVVALAASAVLITAVVLTQ